VESRLLKQLDWAAVITVVILQALGLVLIASASSPTPESALASPYFQRQLLWLPAGLAAMTVGLIVDYRMLRRYSNWLYAINIILLLVVLAAGKTGHGAPRWFMLGPIRFQPSELSKVMVIITLANLLAVREDSLAYWSDCFWPIVHVLIPTALILLEPDLGTSLVLLAILLGELYAAGASGSRLLTMVGTALGGAVATVLLHLRFGLPLPLKEYQLQRLIAFLDETADPTGAGYHLKQSIIAIGSGQVTGQGLFRGGQSQMHYLPEKHTDFIFSVLGEELGFIGVIVLLLLFLFLLTRMLHIVTTAQDRFGAIMATGVVSMLAFHIIINIGMTMRLAPITGLPLPFISYGGSAMVAYSLGVGLVLNVGMRRRKILF